VVRLVTTWRRVRTSFEGRPREPQEGVALVVGRIVEHGFQEFGEQAPDDGSRTHPELPNQVIATNRKLACVQRARCQLDADPGAQLVESAAHGLFDSGCHIVSPAQREQVHQRRSSDAADKAANRRVCPFAAVGEHVMAHQQSPPRDLDARHVEAAKDRLEHLCAHRLMADEVAISLGARLADVVQQAKQAQVRVAGGQRIRGAQGVVKRITRSRLRLRP